MTLKIKQGIPSTKVLSCSNPWKIKSGTRIFMLLKIRVFFFANARLRRRWWWFCQGFQLRPMSPPSPRSRASSPLCLLLDSYLDFGVFPSLDRLICHLFREKREDEKEKGGVKEKKEVENINFFLPTLDSKKLSLEFLLLLLFLYLPCQE